MNLDTALEAQLAEERHQRERVIVEARHLARDLTRFADGLELDEEDVVSSTGIVQGRGPGLDTTVGLFVATRDARRVMQRIMEEASS